MSPAELAGLRHKAINGDKEALKQWLALKAEAPKAQPAPEPAKEPEEELAPVEQPLEEGLGLEEEALEEKPKKKKKN